MVPLSVDCASIQFPAGVPTSDVPKCRELLETKCSVVGPYSTMTTICFSAEVFNAESSETVEQIESSSNDEAEIRYDD